MPKTFRPRRAALALCRPFDAALGLCQGGSAEVGVDWLGNDIVIEAIADPDVEGRDLPCRLFRPRADRPACRRATGSRIRRTPQSPAARPGRSKSAISTSAKGGEEIFKELALADLERSWSSSASTTAENNTLIYLSHSRPGPGRLRQDGDLHRAASTARRNRRRRNSRLALPPKKGRQSAGLLLHRIGMSARKGAHHFLDHSARRRSHRCRTAPRALRA